MENWIDIDDDGHDIFLRDLRKVRKAKVFRERPDFFNLYDETEFFKRFRLTKNTVMYILELIEEQLEFPTDQNQAISPATQLLLTLRFYALGTILQAVSDYVGVSEASGCVIVNRVTRVIASLRPQFVKFPDEERELLKLQQNFYDIAHFPCVVGAMDCTHVKIQSPGGAIAENFRNRKGYFSINVQTICNTEMQVMDIVARWPGASHDSTIFNSSNIKRKFEDGVMGNGLLLADSGYELRHYVMTPLNHPATPTEQLYNESHIRTRNVIERMYGVWKRRFPILSVGMRVKLPTVLNIIVATAVLHNIACKKGEEEPPNDPDVNINFKEIDVEVVNAPNGRNDAVRRNLINNYFSRL